MTEPFAVIGAGAAGLAVLRALRQRGVAVEVLERRAAVGGVFAARPDQSVHLTASGAASALRGSPFPVAGRPSFAEAHAYLDAFAGPLRPWIHCGVAVERMQPRPGGGWWLTTGGGVVRGYRGVVLAVGRTGGPRWCSSRVAVLPASEFAGPEQVAGSRVVVAGGGRAACDIAAEASWSARSTLLSARRRSFAGVEREIADHGLPRPDPARLGERRGSGTRRAVSAVSLRPPLRALVDGRAVFADGRHEQVDVVIDAGGTGIDLPFLDHWVRPVPGSLLLGVADPNRLDLFAAGCFRTAAPAWPILDRQAELIAALATAPPAQVATFRARAVRRPTAFDVDCRRYVRRLQRATDRLAWRSAGAGTSVMA